MHIISGLIINNDGIIYLQLNIANKLQVIENNDRSRSNHSSTEIWMQNAIGEHF